MPELLELLTDEVTRVRGNAIEALGRIGDPSAVPALIKLLSDETPYLPGLPSLNAYAADALSFMRTPEALKAVRDWQRSRSGKVPPTS